MIYIRTIAQNIHTNLQDHLSLSQSFEAAQKRIDSERQSKRFKKDIHGIVGTKEQESKLDKLEGPSM